MLSTAHMLAVLLLFSAAHAATTEVGYDGSNRGLESGGNITIRGGVLIAPPFAIFDESTGTYTGFQGDLLRRLQIFAKDDGYNLNFELELSPPQYGAALDLVANDCNTTDNPHPSAECERFDLIIGDYYCNAPRSVRVDFSPALLRTTISTVKTIKDRDDPIAQATDFTTLTQLQASSGTVCVPEGAYLSEVVMTKFPNANYNKCPGPDECIQRLKNGVCGLYADDELALRYRALNDPSLEVTGEQFNSQFIVWPISYKVDRTTSLLLKKWIYAAVSNATLDELSYKYFTVKFCPLGRAGENCDKPCDPKHGLSDRSGNCICSSTKWAGDDCSIEVMEDLNLYPTWLVVLSYTFFGINAVSCIYCAGWLYSKRHTRHVKVSQPFFLNLVLLGCFLSSSAIIPAVQQSAGDGPVLACAFFPWLFSLGFSITFGTLFSKILRVYRLFQAAARTQRICITVKDVLLMICGITSVDVLICTIWTIIDPLHWTRVVTSADKFGIPLSSEGYCVSNHWKIFTFLLATWHMILLILACVLCYISRNIPTKFSEGKYLAITMISTVQIFIISIPVLIIVGGEPTSSLFVRVTVIWLSDFAIILIIFGNLMHAVHFHGQSRLSISIAIRNFASGGSRGSTGSRGRSRFSRGSNNTTNYGVQPRKTSMDTIDGYGQEHEQYSRKASLDAAGGVCVNPNISGDRISSEGSSVVPSGNSADRPKVSFKSDVDHIDVDDEDDAFYEEQQN